MTAVDIGAIRTWLASQATSAAGVKRALAYQPKSVNARDLPLVTIGNPESIVYGRTFGFGSATVTLRATALVSEALKPEEATGLLDDFVTQSLATSAADASLVAMLRNEQSSDAVPWTSKVVTAENYGLFQVESSTYFGVQIVVEIRT